MSDKKIAVFSWGRFNPPTMGHLVVFKEVVDIAYMEGGKAFIFPTRTHDNDRNPLPVDVKVKFIRMLFPGYLRYIVNKPTLRTIFDVLSYIKGLGFTDAIMVVGQDRLKEFQELFKEEDKGKLGFNTFEIRSAGKRDTKSKGVSGISASELREFVKKNNWEKFKDAYQIDGNKLSVIQLSVVKELFSALKKNFGINNKGVKEERANMKTNFRAWLLNEKYNSGAEHNWDLYRQYKMKMDEASEDKSGFLVIDEKGKGHLPTKKNGKPNHKLMGTAHAALTSGFRGHKYEGPGKTSALKKLRSLYKQEKLDWPKE